MSSIDQKPVGDDLARPRRVEQEVPDLLDEPSTLPALLDKIAAELHDAPALSDEAASRAGIYADHP